MRRLFLAAAATLGFAATAAASPSVIVTYEAAGVQNTTATFDYKGVETFNSRATGSQGFTTDFGTTGQPSTITGTYSGVTVNAANVYGGAGSSNYAVTFSTTGYSVSNLATNGVNGINYFGYWLSALDNGNRLDLLSGGQVIFTFSPSDVIAAIGGCPNASNPYCGNPVAGGNHGGNAGQPYVFVNFFITGGTIDGVRFYESPQVGGYESDNHTVGYYVTTSGTAIPEPASMTLLGLGLLGLGIAARRRG